ncbi:MAG: hypothetical protein ACTS5A_01600 [Candidatus Hodgkinia cicadicola]
MRRKDRSTEESLMGFRGIKWSEGELCSKKRLRGRRRGEKRTQRRPTNRGETVRTLDESNDG